MLGAARLVRPPVVALRERGGRTKTVIIREPDKKTLCLTVFRNVEKGSALYTDENKGYTGIHRLGYDHQTINHGIGEYVRKNVSTNAVESAFALVKRGLHGVYHKASTKHLKRYLDEFAFRLNEGNVKRHSLERLDSFVDAVTGKRITYKKLTAGEQGRAITM